MGDDGSWRTSAFRQSVVSKIDEAIRQSGVNTSRNSIEMENHVFQKAKTMEEYLGYVTRLILHIREMKLHKPNDDGSWRTPAFRQSVVSKIDEAIRQSGVNTFRNSIEMENHVFQKAKTMEEYLGYVTRLILHIREMKLHKPNDDGSWRTPAFRQSVVSKIDETIRQYGMNTSRNSIEMENHVFQKAKTMEEYLGYVHRLILHVREMNTKKGAGMGVPMGNPMGG